MNNKIQDLMRLLNKFDKLNHSIKPLNKLDELNYSVKQFNKLDELNNSVKQFNQLNELHHSIKHSNKLNHVWNALDSQNVEIVFKKIQEENERKSEARSRKIVLPPGSNMFQLARLLVSKKRYVRVFEPLRADWFEEYIQAINEDASWLRRTSIHIRNIWYFADALGLLGWYKLIKKIIGSFSTK